MLALIVGVATGYGAVAFRGLIGLIHNLAFLGTWSVNYDANVFTEPSPLGAFIILVPVAGAVVVTFLVKNFAPEARGHGVPEVMNAVYHHGGHIRPIVVIVKSLASTISLGTGAAMTAIVMFFEMTRDYDIVLPMILAGAMAQGIRRFIMQDNIYTLKLSRRCIPICSWSNAPEMS